MPIFLALILTMVSETNMPLAPCPATPNCVSSQATDGHYIAPLAITGEGQVTFSKLLAILGRRSDSTIIAGDAKTIRVEFKTTLGFIDDAIFVLDSENGVIHVRSAARTGYWDLAKNRRRMEEIRRQLAAE
jgi:uncharacterized protein (DUF1499 family)